MRLTFHGGAGSVTGANYLLESNGTKILIDCGLEQGGSFAERGNFEPFPYNPAEIQAVLVTHAHIDHIGRIPKLVKDGFKGTVYSTPPTKDFSEFLLLDSEHLLRIEADREKRPPIYAVEDVRDAMSLWQGIKYHHPIEVGDFKITFYNAGHILGSSFIQIEAEGKKIVFSGDLGNTPAPVIPEHEKLPAVDYCLIESTYGDRLHENTDTRREELEDAIEDVVKSGGTLLIPAFAMERTQDLLYHLNALVEEGRVPQIPVYVDSPLAIKLTEVYGKYKDYFDSEARKLIKEGDDILNFKGLYMALTPEQSKEINHVPSPKIVIAGSGMSQGGRILHHEIRYLPDPKSMILFVGFQAQGSLGRRLIEGASHVTIFGESVPVRCKVRVISAYSAHADQPRLLEWLKSCSCTPMKVFVVQGEERSSATLAQKIQEDLHFETKIPVSGETVEL